MELKYIYMYLTGKAGNPDNIQAMSMYFWETNLILFELNWFNIFFSSWSEQHDIEIILKNNAMQ